MAVIPDQISEQFQLSCCTATLSDQAGFRQAGFRHTGFGDLVAQHVDLFGDSGQEIRAFLPRLRRIGPEIAPCCLTGLIDLRGRGQSEGLPAQILASGCPVRSHPGTVNQVFPFDHVIFPNSERADPMAGSSRAEVSLYQHASGGSDGGCNPM